MSEVVYFIKHQGLVKIGTTGDVASRLKQIGSGRGCSIQVSVDSSVELLATMPGGRAVEQSIHEMFACLRYHGEWFFLDDPLTSFVQAVAAAESASRAWRARARGPRPDTQETCDMTLREAIDAGLLPWSWEAARKRLERKVGDPPKPTGLRGQAHTYNREELTAWGRSPR